MSNNEAIALFELSKQSIGGHGFVSRLIRCCGNLQAKRYDTRLAAQMATEWGTKNALFQKKTTAGQPPGSHVALEA